MNWPNDADGDVFRRLKESGFNFELEHDIEFLVDFESWPPAQEVVDKLKNRYGNVELYSPEEDSEGYLLFNIKNKVTYDFVVNIQDSVTILVKKFGGVCEAWGLLH